MIGESVYTEVDEQGSEPIPKSHVGAVSGPHMSTIQVQRTINPVELQPNFSYGQPTSGNWVALDSNSQVSVGDTLRMKFSLSIPFLMDYQRDFIVWKLNQDSRFILRSVRLNEEIRLVEIEVETVKDFSPAFLVPVVIIGLLAGALILATTISIERLSTVSVGGYEIKGTPFITIGLLAVGALFLMRRAGS